MLSFFFSLLFLFYCTSHSYAFTILQVVFASGNPLSQWPLGGWVLMTAPQALVPLEKTSLRGRKQFTHAVGGYFEVTNNSISQSFTPSRNTSVATSSILSKSSDSGTGTGTGIGITHQSILSEIQKGRIIVYGDSSCFEQEPISKIGCEKLLTSFLDFID